MNQSKNIKIMINNFLDAGMTNKRQIYKKVKENFPEVPRPTIRRACRDLKLELKAKVKILESGFENNTDSQKGYEESK